MLLFAEWRPVPNYPNGPICFRRNPLSIVPVTQLLLLRILGLSNAGGQILAHINDPGRPGRTSTHLLIN